MAFVCMLGGIFGLTDSFPHFLLTNSLFYSAELCVVGDYFLSNSVTQSTSLAISFLITYHSAIV